MRCCWLEKNDVLKLLLQLLLLLLKEQLKCLDLGQARAEEGKEWKSVPVKKYFLDLCTYFVE